MNILPKKRWHVRTKANIERVRKDEAEARQQEEKEKRRIQIVEREAKINYLRKKKNSGIGELIQQPENFLGNLDNAFAGSNKEHDEEEKERREIYEKKIGLLNYLSKSESESKPWYLETKNKLETKEKDYNERRSYIDPLHDMKRFVSSKEKSNPKAEGMTGQNKVKVGKSQIIDNKRKTIDELRAKRLERERKEHEREKRLMQHF